MKAFTHSSYMFSSCIQRSADLMTWLSVNHHQFVLCRSIFCLFQQPFLRNHLVKWNYTWQIVSFTY